ncbi:hypothetical protein ACFL25_00335 [Patescibacteria group bacterium]
MSVISFATFNPSIIASIFISTIVFLCYTWDMGELDEGPLQKEVENSTGNEVIKLRIPEGFNKDETVVSFVTNKESGAIPFFTTEALVSAPPLEDPIKDKGMLAEEQLVQVQQVLSEGGEVLFSYSRQEQGDVVVVNYADGSVGDGSKNKAQVYSYGKNGWEKLESSLAFAGGKLQVNPPPADA